MRLENVWIEKDLAERLDLKIGVIKTGSKQTKLGRCRTLTAWISEGLEYIEIYNRRYFLDTDVVDFMLKFKKEKKDKKSQTLQ